ncbi:MAG: NUDIX domain-containing protein [Anaerolineae bacterium]|nr:NUDIX domain-containing protein [Anaerolineae bacterium]
MSEPFHSHADGYIQWLRARVGHQLIYLVYTTSLVFDDAGRLLVQRRYDFDWLSVPGGALERFENLRTCATRETFEETGLIIDVDRLVGVFSHPAYNLRYPNGDQVQQWTVCVAGRAVGGSIKADGQETLEVFWLDVDEALPQLPPAYQAMVRAAQAHPTKAALEPVYAADTLTEYWAVLREKVGHDAVILPGTMMIVPNERGEILMTRRTDRGNWALPGGYADLGETTTHTAVREIREETGLEIEPVRVIGVYSETPMMMACFANGDLVHNVGIAFECRITGGTLKADGTETAEVAFKSIDDMLAMDFLPIQDTPHVLRDFTRPDRWPVLR